MVNVISVHRVLQIVRKAGRFPEVWRCFRGVRNSGDVAAGYVLRKPLQYPFKVRLRSGRQLIVEDWDELTTVWHVLCGAEYIVPASSRTILDLGANFGAFAIWVSSHSPNARIFSVEPFPSTYSRLCEHIQINSLSQRVTCLQLAVSGTNGMARFDATEGKRSYCRTLLAPESMAPSVDVESVTLAALLDRCQLDELDCLKMDVEGAEYDILLTSETATLRRIRLITMEYHDAERAASLWAKFADAGFQQLRLTTGGWSGLATFQRVD
jgi:FkbM family methyltransferase